MKDRRQRNKIKKAFYSFLVISLLFLVILLCLQTTKLYKVTSDLRNIEYLNAGTQRLSKLVGSGLPTGNSMPYLDETYHSFLTKGNPESLDVLVRDDVVDIADEILCNWAIFKEFLQDEEPNPSDLHLSSEQLFYQISDLITYNETALEQIHTEVTQIQVLLIMVTVTMVLMLLEYNLGVRTDMKFHALRAKMASIDTATGLLNGSSCQDLIKTSRPREGKVSAIIVFDLNDLKKANDSQGHQVGDALIFTFGYALREAGLVHSTMPFLGRYGGDEFIVYYDGVDGQKDVDDFLTRLREIVNEINQNESRFQVSFAVGYAINAVGNPLSTKELFDEADQIMYRHKIISKENKAFCDSPLPSPMDESNLPKLDQLHQEFLEEYSLEKQTRRLAFSEKRKNRNIFLTCALVSYTTLLIVGAYVEGQKDYIRGNVLYLPSASSVSSEMTGLTGIMSPWYLNSTENMLLYENLFSTDSTLKEVNPALASSYAILDEGYTYEITLKPNLFWSDGVPLTLDDVVFSIESILLCPTFNTYLSYGLHEIRGVEAWQNGTANSISGLSIEDNVLTIRLERPYNNFILMLTQFAPLPRHTLSQLPPTSLTEEIDFFSNPVCSGIYKVGGVTEEGNLYLVPNEYYYGKTPSIQRVEFLSGYNPSEIDFYYTNVITEMVDFRAILGISEYPSMIHFYRYFVYNIQGSSLREEENPMTDLRVRQALVHALNREELLRSVYFNAGYNIYAGTLSQASSSLYDYDPEKAIALLKEAEYDFDRPIRICYYYSDSISLIFLEKVTQYLEDIGLTVELVKSYTTEESFELRDYDILLKGLSAFDSTDWYFEYLPTNSYLVKVFGDESPFTETVEALVTTPFTEIEAITSIKQQLIKLEQENLYKMPLFTLNQNTYINSNRITLPYDIQFGNAWHRYNLRFEEWQVKKS